MIENVFQIKENEICIVGKCLIPTEEKAIYPTIILAHEFASNMNSTRRYALPLCQAGYQVFIFDYAGSSLTKSTGREDKDASILTEKEEFEMVFRYVKSLPSVDRNHIILAGCSQGGMGAALVAGEHPEEIEKLIMYYPALCGPDYMRHGHMMGKSWNPEEPPEYLPMFHDTGIGKKFILDFASLDPWKEITTFQGPVLICHGTADTIASIRFSREARQRYACCELLEIPEGEHIFKNREHFDKAIRKTLDFLR